MKKSLKISSTIIGALVGLGSAYLVGNSHGEDNERQRIKREIENLFGVSLDLDKITGQNVDIRIHNYNALPEFNSGIGRFLYEDTLARIINGESVALPQDYLFAYDIPSSFVPLVEKKRENKK